MKLFVTVFTKDSQREDLWVQFLKSIVGQMLELEVQRGSEPGELGHVILVDQGIPNLDAWIDSLDRRGKAVLLAVHDPSNIPKILLEGKVDDVLVEPFRPLEVFSKLRQFGQVLLWNHLSELNLSLAEVLENLQQDLMLAERLQKSKLPRRFPQVKGFQIVSRFIAGSQAGGDYFDLAEARDESALSVVLTDSSSYGLSGVVLSALVRLAVKLASPMIQQEGAVREVVRQLYEEFIAALKEKDQISLFFGAISRKQSALRYLNFGNSHLFYADSQREFQLKATQGAPFKKQEHPVIPQEQWLPIAPGGRIVLVSHGVSLVLGGVRSINDILNQTRHKDGADVLNELTYQVKAKLNHEEEMPPRDCTVVIFDVDTRLLKLTKQEQDEN